MKDILRITLEYILIRSERCNNCNKTLSDFVKTESTGSKNFFNSSEQSKCLATKILAERNIIVADDEQKDNMNLITALYSVTG